MSNILRSQDETTGVLAHVSRNLRAIRTERGMSQTRLAEVSGLSRRMINAVESGAANISLATVDRLCTALQVSFTQMVRPPGARDNSRLEVLGWKGRNAESQAILLGAAPGSSETELWLWSLAPGEVFHSEEIAGTWQEAVFVLSGELTLTWPERADVVRAQDFRIFSSSAPYTFTNAGTERLTYLRVLVL